MVKTRKPATANKDHDVDVLAELLKTVQRLNQHMDRATPPTQHNARQDDVEPPTSVQQQGQVSSAPVMAMACSHFPSSPIQKFRDDAATHPVDFLESMDYVFRRQNVPPQFWVRTAIENMEGAPRQWGMAFEKKWATYALFEKAFKDTYWSAQRQAKLKGALQNSSYNKQCDGTMAEFMISWMLKVKHLSPPMGEFEFVNSMTQVFPASVENLILAANIETEEALLTLITKLDSSQTRRHERHAQASFTPQTARQGQQNSFAKPAPKPATQNGNWRQPRDNRPSVNMMEASTSGDKQQQQPQQPQQPPSKQQQPQQQQKQRPIESDQEQAENF